MLLVKELAEEVVRFDLFDTWELMFLEVCDVFEIELRLLMAGDVLPKLTVLEIILELLLDWLLEEALDLT